MKKNKTHAKKALLASALLVALSAGAQETRTGYAVYDGEDWGTKGLYTFDLTGDNVTNLNLFSALNFERAADGFLLGDEYFYSEYTTVYNGIQCLGFYAYNLEEKTTRQIVDWGAATNGPMISSFSYDYYNQVMYGIGSFNGGNQIATIDMETGTITNGPIAQLDIISAYAQEKSGTADISGDHLHVMASSYDGDFYAVSYWGSLYKVNVHTGACSFIGQLDYNPGQAFMYSGDDLTYDNETNTLLLRFTWYDFSTYQWGNDLVRIDPKTGKCTQLTGMETRSLFNGLNLPFTVAEASAPARVNNLKMTIGEKGALTTTLTWDNPEKTYGRGGTLEELNYVLVLRDNEVVDSIVNPTIGGHVTWTDNNLSDRGYYTYKIIPGNSLGRGDRASISSYVGVGDPRPVTNLAVTAEGSNAVLTWTEPTDGRFDSYINTDELKYDVLRRKYTQANQQKAEDETIATGVTGTTYTDESITEMYKYIYTIVPHTAQYTGESTEATAVVAGPAFTLPHTFAFTSSTDVELWTMLDGNGNYSVWNYTSGGWGRIAGLYNSYAYDGYAANDLAISPRLQFEANKHYKVTFDAQGADKVTQTLAITFGKGLDFEGQDSVAQFDFTGSATQKFRANLPVISEDGEYHIGFYDRSYQQVNYATYVGNIVISEDHEGYIKGQVTANGQPVAGATVYAGGGEFTATTDENGNYQLNYLPKGTQEVNVIAYGYENASASAEVVELETTDCNISLTSLAAYGVKGTVKDIAGDPVEGAKVALSGYTEKTVTTDATGAFSFPSLFVNDNYAVTITKNKLVDETKTFAVNADLDLGTITLSDKVKSAQKVKAEATDASVKVSWDAPANDAVEDRIDDGVSTTAVGISDATSNTLFGVVKRDPATVSGVNFWIDGTASVTHYSVYLYIFDLDENGNPTDNILYKNTYVPATDGQWNSYTLPAPVDCPNGYYIAIASYNYLLVGIDGGGDSEAYPFVEGVNCFTPDYTTGNYLYLEGQSNSAYHHNFMIRPIAAPKTVAEDATEFSSKAQNWAPAKNLNQGVQVELQSEKTYSTEEQEIQAKSEKNIRRTPQSRQRYNVYRFLDADQGNQDAWTLISEKQQAREYTDNTWASLEQGAYRYAVKSAYTDGSLAAPAVSDIIGNKMSTKVTFHITTNTPDNEAYGARVTLQAKDGSHAYQLTADDNGDVTFPDVWKTTYGVDVQLDGFIGWAEDKDFSAENSFDVDVNLVENQIKPFNLVIEDETVQGERHFIWNYPDRFDEGFEDHEDFALNSPGTIGWQYIDGDACETGGVYNYTWDNQFAPMAYQVFNPYATTGNILEVLYNLTPYSGQKMLTDWAAYGAANDDYIITPKLYFAQDFNFSFYAKSTDYSYLEEFQVGYSTTDTDPESFTWLDETPVQAMSYYNYYSYNIPAAAKYVAIHCVSNEKRIFMIDNISFGIPGASGAKSNIALARKAARRAPSLDGLYEIYLDGVKVAQQDATDYTFTNVADGHHVAGVIASYTSGQTEMSTIEFDQNWATGIKTTSNSGLNVIVNGRTLAINGAYDKVQLFATDGSEQHISKKGNGDYSLSGVPAGLYIVKVTVNGTTRAMKVRLQ